MNRKLIKKYFTSLLFIIASLLSLSGQTEVKISNEKVSIDGVAYYVHIVKKGETLYSISRAYSVSTETLLKENRSTVYGLREGDPLKIPVVNIENRVTPDVVHDPDKFVYHTIQEGETVFALSKKYNIPEDEIRESNPGVNIFDIPVGAEIAIPKRNFREEPKYFTTNDQSFLLHKVERGESLSDIAKLYDITVRELKNVNRRIIFPKTGEFLRIPRDEGSFSYEQYEPVVEVDSLVLEDENITLLFDGYDVDYTPVNNLDATVDVVVLLPLYLSENSQRSYIDSSEYNSYGKKIYKRIKRPEDWIYSRSGSFVEYYEGILLAVSELKSKGLSVNLKVFDTEADSVIVENLIRDDKLDDADLIIGPVYTYNVELVSKYAKRRRIPLVSPLATRNSAALKENPYLFKVQPSLDVVEEAMARVISEYYDYNLVFVHSDTAWSENLSSDFKSKIFRKLRYVVPFNEINFREVFFTSRSAYNDTINIIDHALSKDRPNLIIIASYDQSVMEDVLITVHTLLKNYNIEVFGYPELGRLDNLDPIYFYDLQAMFFSSGWVDYNQPDVKDFIQRYRGKFNMEPQLNSYSWQSYDIAYYFLSGLGIHGSFFMYQPGRHRPDLLQADYDFSRTGLTYGFENNKLFLVRYSKDMSVEFPRFNRD